jgi:hypothetical protein
MNGHKLRISTTTAMEHCVVTAITKSVHCLARSCTRSRC